MSSSFFLVDANTRRVRLDGVRWRGIMVRSHARLCVCHFIEHASQLLA